LKPTDIYIELTKIAKERYSFNFGSTSIEETKDKEDN